MLGVDYAWGNKDYDALKRAGVQFAMRYISHDPGKDLTVQERVELQRRGISVGLVFETTAGRARGGAGAGNTDGLFARQRALSLGLPNCPVYFAVDFDATDADKPVIARYLAGAAHVLRPERVGVYGGYWVVKYAVEHAVCKFFWQTYAWSGGRIHPSNHIYQYMNGRRIGGLSVDFNRGRDNADIGVRPLRLVPPAPKPQPKPRRWAFHTDEGKPGDVDDRTGMSDYPSLVMARVARRLKKGERVTFERL